MKFFLPVLGLLTIDVSTAFAEGPYDAVDRLARAMLANDRAAVVDGFTQGAGYAYSLDGPLRRGNAFDEWLTSDITGPRSVLAIEMFTVSADTVDADVLSGGGAYAETPARYVFTIVDGKVDAWRMTQR